VATIASGLLYAAFVLIAPMPWPWLLGFVWLGFVIAAVVAAFRAPNKALFIPILAALVGLGFRFVGQNFLGWVH